MNNLEIHQHDLEANTTQDVSLHPEWDEVQQRLASFFITRDIKLVEQKHLLKIHGTTKVLPSRPTMQQGTIERLQYIPVIRDP